MVPFIGTIIGSEGGGAVELRRGEEGAAGRAPRYGAGGGRQPYAAR
jgi:hypothetical protein